MTDRELMQQALDALEEINKLSIGESAICLPAEIDTAMDALRERLAQPEQELICVCGAIWEGQELVSTPPQRTWVGLTDDEIALICGECAASAHKTDDISYARAIEAKLKEKNT